MAGHAPACSGAHLDRPAHAYNGPDAHIPAGPDEIISMIVAIDENDRENGAMRVLTRSHTLGRLDHGVYGGQAGADPERVLAAMDASGFEVRSLLLKPGDVAFTHSNLLHCSRPNLSDRWRRNLIIASVHSLDGGKRGSRISPRSASRILNLI